MMKLAIVSLPTRLALGALTIACKRWARSWLFGGPIQASLDQLTQLGKGRPLQELPDILHPREIEAPRKHDRKR